MSYDQQKKAVYIGLVVLAVITLIEVLVSLLGKGHLVAGLEENRWAVRICTLLIVALSLYKAKYIIYEFMHMAHEVPTLVKSVLLPTALLIWAVIAFIWEGTYWKNSRKHIEDKNKMELKVPSKEMGADIRPWSKELN